MVNAAKKQNTETVETAMSWTTPADIRNQLQRLWDNGSLLGTRLTTESLFPRDLRLRRPSSRDLAERFSDVQHWVRVLQAGAREQRGFGYNIQWQRINHRVHGANDLPGGATVPTEADALRLLGKTREAERFSQLATDTLARFPSLRPWLERRPLTVLQHAEHWPRLLDVLTWFRDHPRPGIYLRQLDIPGVDTKFIEGQRGLLTELLDHVLAEEAIDEGATGVRAFERRYGLRPKPPLIRFRVLDPILAIQGLTDLSVPPEQFASLHLSVQRVFITENEINGLAFPDCPASVVIFGLGYGLDRLRDIPWLHHATIHYWGDIDTHGFAILNRLRSAFPHSRSLLMDRATLDAHSLLWGQEPEDRRFLGELPRLTDQEARLFTALRDDTLGNRIRLEQERIGFDWVRSAVDFVSR